MARESLVLGEVEGKPATVLAGGVVAPDYFGAARLQLLREGCEHARSPVACGHERHAVFVPVGEHPARQIHALLQREHGGLVGVGGDRDDHVVEDAGRAPHQVVVPVGDRIERARVDGVAFHAGLSGLGAACANR